MFSKINMRKLENIRRETIRHYTAEYLGTEIAFKLKVGNSYKVVVATEMDGLMSSQEDASNEVQRQWEQLGNEYYNQKNNRVDGLREKHMNVWGELVNSTVEVQ